MLHLRVLKAALDDRRGRGSSWLRASCLLVPLCLLVVRLGLVLALGSRHRRILRLQVMLWLWLKVGHLDPHLPCMAVRHRALVEDDLVLAV